MGFGHFDCPLSVLIFVIFVYQCGEHLWSVECSRVHRASGDGGDGLVTHYLAVCEIWFVNQPPAQPQHINTAHSAPSRCNVSWA